MKPIHLLFDATLLGEKVLMSKPTGMYFAAYNILQKFIDGHELRVTLYSEPEFFWSLKELCKELFPHNELKIISRNDFFYISRFLCYLSTILIIKKRSIEFVPLRKTVSLMIKIFIFFGKKISLVNNNFPQLLKQFDIFFSPCYKPPIIIKNCNNIICFTLLHDITPLKFGLYWDKWWFDLTKSISHDDYFFNDSAFTRQDFISHFPQIDPEKSFVSLLAASDNFRVISDKTELLNVRKKYGIDIDIKYIFSLCTLGERKNLLKACTAFIEFVKSNGLNDITFVFGGSSRASFFEKLKQVISEDDFKYIKYIGYVDDQDLPALYSGSHWFVYTSSYEGFGLPPLEAMQCGCPVIASNATSLPEVVGDAGISIDYDSMEQHIEAYKTYYYNDAIRCQNREKGIERAKLFSWEKTANTMIKEFNIALGKK
jgi:glycosyltransferase involved in cell wall biosynthesis